MGSCLDDDEGNVEGAQEMNVEQVMDVEWESIVKSSTDEAGRRWEGALAPPKEEGSRRRRMKAQPENQKQHPECRTLKKEESNDEVRSHPTKSKHMKKW